MYDAVNSKLWCTRGSEMRACNSGHAEVMFLAADKCPICSLRNELQVQRECNNNQYAIIQDLRKQVADKVLRIVSQAGCIRDWEKAVVTLRAEIAQLRDLNQRQCDTIKQQDQQLLAAHLTEAEKPQCVALYDKDGGFVENVEVIVATTPAVYKTDTGWYPRQFNRCEFRCTKTGQSIFAYLEV